MATHRFEHGLYVQEGGRGQRAIVYLHGLGESGLCFEPLLHEPMLAGWRHLAIDLPGYGKTPWRRAPLGLDALADAVADWITAMRLGDVVLVGHAMGGVVALRVCERAPFLVRAFLDVEGNVSAEDCVFSGEAAEYAPDTFVREGFDRVLGRLYDAGAKDPSLRSYYASMRICDPRQLHLNSRELVAISSRGDIARRLAVLAAPVRYIAGVPDGTSLTSRQMLAEAGVPCNAVQNSGHWPFIDQPGAFAEAFASFLVDHGGGSP
jgi:pimeloyl-ACP methyl ester carboxylesterase